MCIRLYLPRRVLSVANCGSFGHEEYPELGTRFKAAHIKIMCWWIAVKVQELARDSEAQHLKTRPHFSTLPVIIALLPRVWQNQVSVNWCSKNELLVMLVEGPSYETMVPF